MMRDTMITTAAATALVLAPLASALAQGAAIPALPYGSPAATSTGPVSPVTGYSENGRGGTGGMGGGPSTSGTAAGAGTATGGNPSGYPDRN